MKQSHRFRNGQPFLVAEIDDRVSCAEYVDNVGPEPKTLLVIPDVDHLLRSYEQEVAGQVAEFLRSTVG